MWIRALLVALVVAAVGAVAAVAALLLRPVEPGLATATQRTASGATPPVEPVSSDPGPRRTAVEPVAVDAEFVSEGYETGVAAGAVRDGVVILLLGQDRQPVAGAKLDVKWRKGWGNYGNDRGRTDPHGRFPTTIAEHEMIEGVTLRDPALGDLEHWFDFLPMLAKPRTVLVIAARLVPVTIRVVDQRGLPVAGARVEIEGGRPEAAPREHVLVPAASQARSSADGCIALRLPPCAHAFKATAEGHLTLYSVQWTPSAGRTLTLHLLDRSSLHDVVVTVVAPPELPAKYRVQAWTKQLPPDLPGLEPQGVEPLQVDLGYRVESPRRIVVQSPWLPWRAFAHTVGFAGSVEVGASDAAATLEMKALPVPSAARLKCRLLLPDGRETSGEVMVHKTPDLVYGAREQVSPRDPFVTVAPGGKVCASAWRRPFPPVVVGPIELGPGDHEVTFQFSPPMSIRGRIVDEHGRPARGTVSLRRPAGALRALDPSIPAILAQAAKGDSHGIGEQGEGRFCFDNLGPGKHELYVMPEGLGWPARVRAMAGDQDVVATLGTGIDDLVRVQGRVSMAGQPVAGAQVRWQGEHWNGCSWTDAEGRYTHVAKPGRLRVEVWARRCAVLRGDDEDFTAGPVTRDLVLTPSEPLFVRVRDAEGAVPEVEISGRDERGRDLVFLDANGNYDGEVMPLDSSGRIVLRGLPAAKFTLIVREREGEDDKKAVQEVEVPADTPRGAEFTIVWQPARKGP